MLKAFKKKEQQSPEARGQDIANAFIKAAAGSRN
jgi:hypothetical protein